MPLQPLCRSDMRIPWQAGSTRISSLTRSAARPVTVMIAFLVWAAVENDLAEDEFTRDSVVEQTVRYGARKLLILLLDIAFPSRCGGGTGFRGSGSPGHRLNRFGPDPAWDDDDEWPASCRPATDAMAVDLVEAPLDAVDRHARAHDPALAFWVRGNIRVAAAHVQLELLAARPVPTTKRIIVGLRLRLFL
eukprot:CAMPEP_0178996580 /NCGR_PEP_ID=MMETSP0795-20121207/8444_1 /TAXON_ID=88552 /ORGANISM="Amoebophrya sp., Strain Ameob2" /LENGTH=190 /DNA_ID=CAMNT_0020688979 /DNA_START=435 /DNA_END=1007 /DNA_ORIENTATION=-